MYMRASRAAGATERRPFPRGAPSRAVRGGRLARLRAPLGAREGRVEPDGPRRAHARERRAVDVEAGPARALPRRARRCAAGAACRASAI